MHFTLTQGNISISDSSHPWIFFKYSLCNNSKNKCRNKEKHSNNFMIIRKITEMVSLFKHLIFQGIICQQLAGDPQCRSFIAGTWKSKVNPFGPVSMHPWSFHWMLNNIASKHIAFWIFLCSSIISMNFHREADTCL